MTEMGNEAIRYKMTVDLLRDEILDLTGEQIADKLSDQFIEKYGAIVLEKTHISHDELQKRVLEKLSQKIIENFVKENK